MNRRTFFAVIAFAAIVCGALGMHAYLSQDWQLSSRFFGIGTLLGVGISITELIRNRSKSNA